jgi:hypothetical protein
VAAGLAGRPTFGFVALLAGVADAGWGPETVTFAGLPLEYLVGFLVPPVLAVPCNFEF